MERELRVGISLERTSDSIGSRWRERLFAAPGSDDAARGLVEDLLRALSEERHSLRLLRSALGYGQACFAEGRPSATLHHRLDALEDTLLEALFDRPAPTDDVDSQGVRARLRLARMAAVTGFTRAACAERVRAARMLRHDIRNPLGTVRNAVEMVAERASNSGDHRLEEMASRNLRTLERLIRERVSDTSSLGPEHGVTAAQAGAMCEHAESLVRPVIGAWPFGAPVISGAWGERTHEPTAVLLTTAILFAMCLAVSEPMELHMSSSIDGGALWLELSTRPSMAGLLLDEEPWRLTTDLADRLGARVELPTSDCEAIRVRLSAWGAELPHDLGGVDERVHL